MIQTTNPSATRGQFMNPRNSFSQDPVRSVSQASIGMPNETVQPIAPMPVVNPNPYIKDSGAPVNFNPRSQQAITGAFGMPIAGAYDRSLATSAL